MKCNKLASLEVVLKTFIPPLRLLWQANSGICRIITDESFPFDVLTEAVEIKSSGRLWQVINQQ
jgi:hypothetical protein